MSEINNKNFIYLDSYGEEHSINITKDDFKQVNLDKKIHDVKFQSKPTTYLKDALRRFYKNKSSVAGGVILGILVLMAILVPLAVTSDINSTHLGETYLEPKLFNAGTGFWDGTRYYDGNMVYDTVNETPAGFVKDAVSELITWDSTTNSTNQYAHGGYVRIIGDIATPSIQTRSFESYTFSMDSNNTYTINYNIGDIEISNIPNANYNVYLKYTDSETNSTSYVYYYDDFVNTKGEMTITLNDLATKANLNEEELSSINVGFTMELMDNTNSQLLVEYVNTSCSDSEDTFNNYGFDDANAQVLLTANNDNREPNVNYWSSTARKSLYGASITYCNFRYDTYAAAYGEKTIEIDRASVDQYIENGWMSYSFIQGVDSFKILDPDKCPITEVYSQTTETGVVTTYKLTCSVIYYRYLGYDSAPRFIFGTDYLGKDLFKLVFAGLRTSLILGVVVTVVNMIIGVIWGAISGYFGGWVDLTMERVTDILGRIPWLVIMTICILYFGQNFFTFGLALCLTGWIGISATTRAQFYRFKGREYVLASRTLGAKDGRLIFKHILPNALGTLVTSCVFLIPSVIFNEASIAYIGLGLQGMDSFGVILSDNQQFLSSYPYLILIPSAIMALLMIAFNLFGNGLRDAFNPSLKGSD